LTPGGSSIHLHTNSTQNTEYGTHTHNNNNNNNNILQMGRHPVAVVTLHITYARTMKVDYSRFSWGGLHGKHVVATWKRK
jgi:hypothetical protein